MRLGAALFALTAAAIVAAWGWLGAAVEMPPSPLGPGEKIPCMSYAPFRGDQDPFGPDVPIDPRQIEEDLAPPQAADRLHPHLFGRSRARPDPRDRRAPRHEGDAGPVAVEPAGARAATRSRPRSRSPSRYPDVIQAIVVGNEVLLRGEMSAPDLANTIRDVKAQVTMPVTYADVWEFWLRYRDIAAGGRFHHHSHPALLGGFPDPGRRTRPPTSTAIRQRGRGRLSGPGDPDRRVRLAERRAHARGRAAVARQPGARRPGGAGAGQARELPRQRDRGLRPALEAPARRHGRRPLGPVRRL